MKIKLKDLTIGQLHAICQVACEDCPLHCGHDYKIACMTDYTNFDDTEVEIPDEFLDIDNCEKEEISRESVAVIGTHWNSQQGPDGYRLQFETDDETLYRCMEISAQTCIDIANINIKRRNKNDSNDIG